MDFPVLDYEGFKFVTFVLVIKKSFIFIGFFSSSLLSALRQRSYQVLSFPVSRMVHVNILRMAQMFLGVVRLFLPWSLTCIYFSAHEIPSDRAIVCKRVIVVRIARRPLGRH